MDEEETESPSRQPARRGGRTGPSAGRRARQRQQQQHQADQGHQPLQPQQLHALPPPPPPNVQPAAPLEPEIRYSGPAEQPDLENGIGYAGHIAKIHCENFMCHEHFEMEFKCAASSCFNIGILCPSHCSIPGRCSAANTSTCHMQTQHRLHLGDQWQRQNGRHERDPGMISNHAPLCLCHGNPVMSARSYPCQHMLPACTGLSRRNCTGDRPCHQRSGIRPHWLSCGCGCRHDLEHRCF